MKKSESITELAKAVISVMKDVKGIEKSMTVGTGNSSYKGVSDKDVKNAIGKAMEKYGLCLLPVEVKPTLQIDRWTETGGQYGDKQKQSVFTSVKTKYLLLHESGEYIEVSGYGHGTDSQDKAAGKATTYALKYAMLYTFMVPTGKIDDAESVHSDEIETPKLNGKVWKAKDPMPQLAPGNPKWEAACAALAKGEVTLEKIEAKYFLTTENRELLLTASI